MREPRGTRRALSGSTRAILLAAVLVACGDPAPSPPSPSAARAPAPASATSRSVNGCKPETATDRTGMAEVEIRFSDEREFRYEPACVRVSEGTRLTFVGNFVTHPLAVGTLGATPSDLDSASPLRATEVGEAATFVMAQRGSYPFFCNLHAWDGMMGAVFVE